MPVTTSRRAGLALLTTGLTGALLLTMGGSPATASSVTGSPVTGSPATGSPATGSPAAAGPAAADAAGGLAARFGARTAGVYLEGTDTVVTVNDEATARDVRAAGAVAKLVARSAHQLAAAEAAVAKAGGPGTAWAVDPKSNQVVVSVDESVAAPRLAQLQQSVAALGDSVRVEHVAGRFTLRSGGDAIYGGSSRCSLGFNVRSGMAYSFLTAGHCGNISSTWRVTSGSLTGTTTASSFPTNDYAIIRYNGSTVPPGDVNLYNGTRQDIVSAGNPVVGQSVQRSGSTTGLRSGIVQRLNATVNYGSGRIVSGLIQTNVCAEPGDSGGSLFAGTVALGLTSGGSGNCTSGGTTFFQPVTEALSAYGVSVY